MIGQLSCDVMDAKFSRVSKTLIKHYFLLFFLSELLINYFEDTSKGIDDKNRENL